MFESRCDEFDTAGDSNHLAVISKDATLTFRDLDNRANQLARYLISNGLGPGDRIGLMFDKSAASYTALLAVQKIHAAYVPLDEGFPRERIAFILEDAGVDAVLSLERYAGCFSGIDVPKFFLDFAAPQIETFDTARPSPAELRGEGDEVAYLIYTSGTTGKPKGVVIEQSSICNFVRVAAETYGYTPKDRVYQGMTIAFDFSVEELWVPLLAGAALVPTKQGISLVGEELADFLRRRQVTAMCCVPTLLATIEEELPDLRLLLVSGEACPQGLISRWHRDGRTILNAYGPTEATVTCTITQLHPDKPVTIGGPLPSYSIAILDPEEDIELADGELGEIAVAGVGLAAGYLNRPNLTARKFVPDCLNGPNNPSRRLYRTGDLGRINELGEIEFHGRIDTQVKIRGYRIELTEIESVLLEVPEISQAVVDTWEAEPGTRELVAYYALNHGVAELDKETVASKLKARLPAYMIPSYLEELEHIPLTVNNKADRKRLPPPSGQRFIISRKTGTAPRSEVERLLADKLSPILNTGNISIDDHFFDDLGAHSLLMARYCAALRKCPGLPSVSMRDIYLNPTIRALGKHAGAAVPGHQMRNPPQVPKPAHIASDREYVLCGAAQFTWMTAYGLFGFWLFVKSVEWALSGNPSVIVAGSRMTIAGFGFLVLFSVVPIAAKWLLVGRWKPERFPVWSMAYFRFWLVKALIRSAPPAFLAGTPVYNVYLRALGAKIGRGTVMHSASPVCTDLLTIGNNTILRREAVALGYQAEAGFIETGPVTVGDNVFIGEACILEIGAKMENGTQLGHASSLEKGQVAREGKRYHGTPAVETEADYCRVPPRHCSELRRWAYTLGWLTYGFLMLWLISSALGAAILGGYVDEFAAITDLREMAILAVQVTLVLYFVAFPAGLLFIGIMPRLAHKFVEPGRVYTLFGFHFFMHGLVAGWSNSRFYNLIFGDSSAIVYYLRYVGYNLNKVVQTGSNFGVTQRHTNPFLCDIGTGTMVSDGLSMINTEYSASSFRVLPVKIGAQNYLGNNIHYPAGGRTGENCLIGTKTMIPVDGPVLENTGLLGSPPFEIPRAVHRDTAMAGKLEEAARAGRLKEKNVHNLNTALIYQAALLAFVCVVLFALQVAWQGYLAIGFFAWALLAGFLTLFTIGYFVFCERASLGFGRLKPRQAIVLDDYFWSHERHWKMTDHPIINLFAGTPMRGFIGRLLGMRVGRKLFDDGGQFVERTLIEIGDNVTVNFGATLQCHSLEEGVFKSDHIALGSGATIGVGGFVHYGARLGEKAVLGANAFLMKGEQVAAGDIWCGNPASPPARDIRCRQSELTM
ncbi:Pls/PosA family non-ribosomal peptide synthetase [Leisingera daeponensis]|uniref:Pls/PosA family non-ribosomal peptide synthetase n=1 Tax=Leisingera daeponensis TaxID=405746 RepID=UPI001C96C52F|nr:Pls/PosA family non-ribosomal peptide synthetase [Leisingera daeponensis]MBY6059663.1 amino acid adenylation domain-containing protein [Leisingera daeponensis]